MRTIKFQQGDKLDEAALRELVRAAVAHNATRAQSGARPQRKPKSSFRS